MEPNYFVLKMSTTYRVRLTDLTWQGHVESNHDLRFWRPLYLPLYYAPLNVRDKYSKLSLEWIGDIWQMFAEKSLSCGDKVLLYW